MENACDAQNGICVCVCVCVCVFLLLLFFCFVWKTNIYIEFWYFGRITRSFHKTEEK